MRSNGCIAWAMLTALLAVSLAEAEVKSHDSSYDSIVPHEAYEGVGTWSSDEDIIATGHSTEVNSLGAVKDKRTVTVIAREDAERRVIVQAATAEYPEFDGDSYDIKSNLTGFQTAATYTLQGRDGLFLIGVVKKNRVHVELIFNPAKARSKAIALFDSGHYGDAAIRFAALSQKGVQDAQTIGYARAASWQVNLKAGITGDSRTEALNGLGHFYLARRDYESSLQQFYPLYSETPRPSRELLDTLVDLCGKTRRETTAANFKAEIGRRWPATQPATKPVPLQNVKIEEPYLSVLTQQPWLLTEGGAAVIRIEKATYFVAVGFTPVQGDSPDERLRQMRVGQAHAQKEAVTFVEKNTVVVHEELHQTTTLTRNGDLHSANITKTLDETVLVQVKGSLRDLSPVGTWKNEDGTIFFYAVAKKLD